jgi:hypothetical protein
MTAVSPKEQPMHRAAFLLIACAPFAPGDEKAEPKDPKAPKAREITVAGKLPQVRGLFDKPTQITTEKELEKSIPDKDTRAAILKKVDLKKEHLVLFAWGGSGGDRLGFTVSKDGKTVTFTRTQGLTDDLRYHVKLFAIPKGAKYKVGK